MRLLFFKVFYLSLIFFICVLFAPGMVFASTDISITVTDPARNQGSQWYSGITVSTVHTQPLVSMGDNRVLGTVRITGKQDVSVPFQSGNKVMITLPPGICYMAVPTKENYLRYVKWPEAIDGKTNQISEVGFVSGTPRTLTVEVTNIDFARNTAILDFVFDEEDYSAVRISRLIEVVDDYIKNPNDKVTRLEYLELLADITIPFSSCPVKFRDSHREFEERFIDVAHLDEPVKHRLKMLADSGIIIGHGIMVGCPDRLLKPDNYITRVEAATFAGRVVPGVHWRPIFKDTLPVWAAYEINNAVDNQIIAGYPDETFKHDRLLVKSEAIEILQRTIEAYSLQRYLKYR